VWLELDYPIINSKVTTESDIPTAVLTSQANTTKKITLKEILDVDLSHGLM
jgi:hypothetical protein